MCYECVCLYQQKQHLAKMYTLVQVFMGRNIHKSYNFKTYRVAFLSRRIDFAFSDLFPRYSYIFITFEHAASTYKEIIYMDFISTGFYLLSKTKLYLYFSHTK